MRTAAVCLIILLVAGCGGGGANNSAANHDTASANQSASKGDDETRAGGEQLLKSLRNHARVGFAKTGELPRKLTGEWSEGGCDKDAQALAGPHYRVRDQLWGKALTGMLLAEPFEAGYDWLILEFQYDTSDSTLHIATSEADALQKIKDLLAKVKDRD